METQKIPKQFHFIWITEDFMKDRNNIEAGHEIVIQSFIDNNPKYLHTIWTNWRVQILIDTLQNDKLRQLLLSNKISLVQKTDILRMIILEKYGGIYSDLDVLCISSFDDLLNNNFFVGEEAANRRTHMNLQNQVAHDMHYVNNTVMGCVQGSKVAKRYLEDVFKVKNIFRISYGPNAIENTLAIVENHEYTILPSDYFFVKDYFTELDTKKLTKNTKIVHFYQGTGKQ